MASTVLYPPMLDSSAPAFIASGDGSKCRLFFSLSKYSTSSVPIKGVHVSIIKQSSGRSVINRVDDEALKRYRSTGILLMNTPPKKVENNDNLYYIDILNSDIKSGEDVGWYPGWIYKIQIRLSTVEYNGEVGQTAWLNANANNFSEWSTYCTTKTISFPQIKIPIMNNFDSKVENNSSNIEKIHSLSFSTLDFNGGYYNNDLSETLYSYRLRLYNDKDKVLEDSDIIYTNQYYSPNEFHYKFKHEFINNEFYTVELSYTTINRFSETLTFKIEISQVIPEHSPISAVTLDNLSATQDENFIAEMNDITSYEKEKDDGLVVIKLFSMDATVFNGNICIRRASSKDNYATWEDIRIIPCTDTVVNTLPPIYDNTIESGVWYRYGVQIIETNGERGLLNKNKALVLREFNYSYLVGENGKQLRLQFDNTLNTYTYNYSESKTDTIGGQYPFITRNGNVKYRTFPVNGLISFNMDENELFTSDKEMYQYTDVINDYKKRRREENLYLYDYRKEFDFREKVLDFLQDGKPKLFKSATEGNIIVRLMQISTQPNQTLNRMIYSFTSTAHEIAEDTLENYRKYNFYTVGEYSKSFKKNEAKIGQLDLDFDIGDDIIQKIWEKYDTSDQNIAGRRISLVNVHHLTLEFANKPLRVINNAGDMVLGNNFLYDGKLFTVTGTGTRLYVFDENIILNKSNSLVVMGGIDDQVDRTGKTINKIHITVDFLYEIEKEPYVEKQIETRTSEKGIGQLFNYYPAGTDLYSELYYKYYYEWPLEFRRLNKIDWTCIEAKPGAIFLLKDEYDEKVNDNIEDNFHEINWTGVLNIEGLGYVSGIEYVGMRQPDGSIDKTQGCDMVLDYIYYLTKGTYKKED